MPFSEEDRVDSPVSLYAATKKSNELMAAAYSKLYSIPATGLRFFTVYGPMGRPDMAYFGFTEKLRRGDTIKIFNMGDCDATSPTSTTSSRALGASWMPPPR